MTDLSNETKHNVTPSAVAEAYDRWAAQYDDDRNLTRDLDAVVLRSAPLELAGRDVLEIGCGTGKNTVWLAEQARSLTSMDFSAGMLAVASKRVCQAHVRFVQHDIRNSWPIADHSIDVVVGNLVLEHIEDLTPLFAEARRVLRSGGQLYFCELHPYRQLRGSQAHFVERDSGETVHIPAFLHSIGEYVNSGIQAGFVLQRLIESQESDPSDASLPRLVSVLFSVPADRNAL